MTHLKIHGGSGGDRWVRSRRLYACPEVVGMGEPLILVGEAGLLFN